MGNQICSAQNDQKSLKNAKISLDGQKTSIISKQHTSGSHDSQNINQADLEEMDQDSPSSKFDIKFLRTSIRASNITQYNAQFSDLASPQNGKVFLPYLIPPSKNQIKKVLQQWSSKGINRLNSIKSYANYIIQNSSPFIDIRISGQNFFKLRNQSITPYYNINKKIGEGSFGSVYKGKCLKTSQMRAIKIIKKKIMNQRDQKALLSQINILKRMDHINIIKLYDVFFFKNFFYVVTQFCQGGSLLQALQKQQIKSQKQVAIIMKQLISAVSYMHHLNIAHRDLKLDNIVLVNQIGSSSEGGICIKLIDFGLSQVVQNQFRNKTGLVGTVSYMAPQIFQQYFNLKSDVWSCGIILCMLLIGFNPFKKKKQNLTIKAIREQQINYKGQQWSKVSVKGKNLVSQMLVKPYQKRISIDQAINHQWIKKLTKNQQIQILHSDYKSQLVINNFNSYHRGNNFMCYIKNFFISRQLTQAHRQQMALIFQKIDTDSSGVIQKQELIELYSLVTGITDQQIEKLIEKIDQNKSGKIDFQQFLLCMTKNQILHNCQCINEAFNFFDQDHTGYIEKNELFDCLQGCQQQQIVRVIKEADFNGDGKISRDEFTNYLLKIKT